MKSEEHWHTDKWYIRVIGTLFGMMVVNAFLAYSFETQRYGSGQHHLSLKEFASTIAHSWIFGEQGPPVGTSSSAAQHASRPSSIRETPSTDTFDMDVSFV